MKKGIILFFQIFFVLKIVAQNSVSVTGVILDAVNNSPIELASIRILSAKDSTYITGTVTDKNGNFSIAVKPANYIAEFSFVGYTKKFLNINTRLKTQFGNILLHEDNVMLGEAVVTAKAVEIMVKGDTVEYNADSYRVQESAVLEDLIKKLPGAEIDSEGKIKVNGKDISKILVDGKEFFSDDPTTASQNLPAKIVDKLQVLDRKSDMAQLTGFDDGEEETVINLIVKSGMKEGIMAKALVGYGNKDRYEGNGFVNYARNDTRVSVLGNVNNTNSVNPNPWVRAKGLTKTAEGGVNFAAEPSTKFKWDGDVFYGNRNNDVETESNREYIAANRFEKSSSFTNTKNDNLRSRFRIEWTLDSLTKIIFKPNLKYNKSNTLKSSNSSLENVDEELENTLTGASSNSDGHTLDLDGNLLINRLLNNKGRLLTFEISGGLSDGDTDGYNYSKTQYTKIDSLYVLDQKNDQKDKSYNWRMRLSYLEPIGHNNFIELAYNIRKKHSETDKKTLSRDDSTDDYTIIDADFTRNTKNDFLNQNISLAFQSRRLKYNYTVGLGLEPSSSKTEIIQPNQDEKKVPRKNYLNIAPRVEFNYLWDKRHNLRIRYDGHAQEATTLQLFDGIISQDGLNKTVGNPNLRPSFVNRMNIRYQKYNAGQASSLMFFANISHTMNDIVTVSKWEGAGQTETYKNISGNMEGKLRLMFNTPLRNKKFSINTSTFGNYERQNTYISQKNTEETPKNTANKYKIGENLRLKFNSVKFQFDLGGNFSFENVNNSRSKEKNQTVYNFGGLGSFSWYLPYDFILESDLTYSSNAGYDSGYKLNEWLWNASLSKQFLKGKNATVSFKMYDILQQRSSISRSSTAKYIEYASSNIINSYFMVNLSFKFQSFKGGAKASDMESPVREPGPGRRPPGADSGHYGGPPVRQF